MEGEQRENRRGANGGEGNGVGGELMQGEEEWRESKNCAEGNGGWKNNGEDMVGGDYCSRY